MSESHRFRGKLLIAGLDDQPLVVDLRVREGAVIIASGGDQLGVWPVEQVAVERVGGERFNISLNGEDAVFLADDALAFSYEAMPSIEEEAALLRDKRRLRRRRDKSVKKLLEVPKARTSSPPRAEPAKAEPAARPAPAPTTPLAPDPFDGWLPEPEPAPRPRPRRKSPPATPPPVPVKAKVSKRAPIEVITPPVSAEVPAVKEKRAAPAAKRSLAPVEPTTVEVATEFRRRPKPKPVVVAAPEAAPDRRTVKGPASHASDASLLELKPPSPRSRPKKAPAATEPAPSAAKSVEPVVPPPDEPVAPLQPIVPAAPAAARAAPASRAWKKMATSASQTLQPAPSAESTSRPAKLRKQGGSGFGRQLEAVEADEAPREAEPTAGRRPWKRAISGGPMVPPTPEPDSGGTQLEIELEPSLAPDEPDPFAVPDLVGTAPAPTPYGIRTRPTGLSARLRRRQEVEPHDHQFVEQKVGAGLLRRVCEVCGHVSVDLSEGEAAGA